jgi:hypothetical protein
VWRHDGPGASNWPDGLLTAAIGAAILAAGLVAGIALQ